MNMLDLCKKSGYFKAHIIRMVNGKTFQEKSHNWAIIEGMLVAYYEMGVLTSEDYLHLSRVLMRIY